MPARSLARTFEIKVITLYDIDIVVVSHQNHSCQHDFLWRTFHPCPQAYASIRYDICNDKWQKSLSHFTKNFMRAIFFVPLYFLPILWSIDFFFFCTALVWRTSFHLEMEQNKNWYDAERMHNNNNINRKRKYDGEPNKCLEPCKWLS